MDLEKIKQNFRLRSGRTKKLKKPRPGTKTTQAGEPNGTVPDPPKPEQPTPNPAPQPKNTHEQGNKPSATQSTENRVGSSPKEDADRSHEAAGTTTLPNAEDSFGQKHSEKEETNTQAVGKQGRNMTEASDKFSSDTDGAEFDLRPPAPKPRPESIETISELLFSPGHLNCLLHEPQSVSKFTAFLNRYKPEYQPLILKYLETQKAITAVAYANAVAECATDEAGQGSKGTDGQVPGVAATLEKAFEEASNASFKALVGTALPMYVTYQLVKLLTECLVNEITGRQTPLMRNLIGGLSEVFCITDPNQDDNPIIYASEEFYRLTGYGADDVIGRNCRFLQGSKTNRESTRRIRESIDKDEDICEAILNYRRDGRPFINLLMIAPLHDDKGKLKYNIGAQVDVSGLVEGGRGLDDFERYLSTRQLDRSRRDQPRDKSRRNKKALEKLRELSEMFDLEESAVVQTHSSRASSVTREDDTQSIESNNRLKPPRRVFVDSEDEDRSGEEQSKESKEAWNLGQSGSSGVSGKLQGVYDSYMLIRPTSSFRIIFVSPKLRKINKAVKNPFLSHVAAPSAILTGLKESFSSGTPVTAKIHLMPEPGKHRYGTPTDSTSKRDAENQGKQCWISATPLLGADDRVGVWMVVIVEKAKARRNARIAEVEAKFAKKSQPEKPRHINTLQESKAPSRPSAPQIPKEELPIKPKRLDDLSTQEVVDREEPESRQEPAQQPEGEPEREFERQSERQPQVPAEPNEKMPHTESHQERREDTPEQDQFVRRTPRPQQPETNGRVIIEPDSEDEEAPERDSDPELSPAGEHDVYDMPRKYTPPPEIPASMTNQTPPPQTPDVRLEDATPTKEDFDEGEREGGTPMENPPHETPTRPPHNLNRSSQLLGMDYLTHPGSRKQPAEGVERTKGSDSWTDVDCMRSPYSVD